MDLDQTAPTGVDLDETGIKIYGLLRSFIKNIVIIRVAVPFKKRIRVCKYFFYHIALLLCL